MKARPGPPATLGSVAVPGTRIIVWCCGHQVEPDPAEMAARYMAPQTPVLDWRDRLFCSLRQPVGRCRGDRDQAAVKSARPSLPRRIMSRKARERINAQPL
jgi:hypothetical protein